jgi:hypothetical protein
MVVAAPWATERADMSGGDLVGVSLVERGMEE